VTRNALGIDLGLAVVAAGVVLALAPGVAVVGLLALLVLSGCGVSLLVDTRRHRRRRRSR
jgi:hypothetical protein